AGDRRQLYWASPSGVEVPPLSPWRAPRSPVGNRHAFDQHRLESVGATQSQFCWRERWSLELRFGFGMLASIHLSSTLHACAPELRGVDTTFPRSRFVNGITGVVSTWSD